MKKITRILCLIAVFAMCLSLCGCGMLDDLRAKLEDAWATGCKKIMIATDGVFSMDGYIADLICISNIAISRYAKC